MIVIPAYNRPDSLKRLLSSLQAAEYPSNIQVPLIISIDPENGGPNPQVRELAESFVWEHGPKDIRLHDKHLGLLENFYYCGGLAQVYGSIIFLEDDLFVSPAFYQYASHCLDFYDNESRIGGISLYCYNRNGFTHTPFIPLDDGTDVFFLQTASILGQVWSSSQWEKFTDWRTAQTAIRPELTDNMHDLWTKFDTDDYFPIVTKYLVSMNRFYVFPRVSYTTGFGDPGVHFADTTSYFQVPLQRGRFDARLPHFDVSEAIYDSFMELSPDCFRRLVPSLGNLDFDVDLNAAKASHNITTPYVITTRACKNPIKTFSLSMMPLEANIIFHVDGSGINLCRRSDILWDKWNELQTQHRLHHYFSDGRGSGLRRSIMHFLLDLINRFQ